MDDTFTEPEPKRVKTEEWAEDAQRANEPEPTEFKGELKEEFKEEPNEELKEEPEEPNGDSNGEPNEESNGESNRELSGVPSGDANEPTEEKPVPRKPDVDLRLLSIVENRTSRQRPRPEHRRLAAPPVHAETYDEVRPVPTYSHAFRYDRAGTNTSQFPKLEYTLAEEAPYTARMHYADRGNGVVITDDEGRGVTTLGPYGSAKGNMCMRGGGSWFFEVEVVRPHVRVGIGRRESSCEAPVGFDAYSYGLQSRTGLKVHCARTAEFMAPLAVGDVVGFHVHLPVDSRPRTVQRTRAPFLFQKQVWMESRDYTATAQMEDFVLPRHYRELEESDPEAIPGSFCNVYRNGELVGPLAAPLRDFRPPYSEFEFWLRLPSIDDGSLGYYPMISVFRGGEARINCGPDFAFSKPEEARPLSDRYEEQVADDFAADLVNELVFEEIDEHTPRLRRGMLRAFRERKSAIKQFF